ncbi:MAG TPA: tricarballylate utilization 4Fe-4S protein TcuB [Allosphingosinicella sp.]|nr:tricarballylate utilization 4Fe-4S protein TcuB [Allosphingosinicella sp.]
MPSTDPLSKIEAEAARQLAICNACRYCEGYCAVFPALQRRAMFASGDIGQLANLCHNCKGCYYACQYIPPHPFAVNLPQVLSEARMESYAAYAWPRGLGRLFERNGVIVSLAAALGVAALLIGVGLAHAPDQLFATRRGPGSFYQVIPWGLMAGLASAVTLYALLAMTIGAVRFWRHSGKGGQPTGGAALPVAQAAGDVLTLRNLGGGGHGCNDKDEGFSTLRRRLHHSMFYGFMLCLASTTVAWFYDHFLGLVAPYPFFSAPVLLGTVGGVGMMIGTGGLLWLKYVADQAPMARRLLGADVALLLLLFLVAATGLVLLALRETVAMGLLLAVHLGFVLALFLVLPYSKFVHGLYRGLALLRDRRERAARSGKAEG